LHATTPSIQFTAAFSVSLVKDLLSAVIPLTRLCSGLHGTSATAAVSRRHKLERREEEFSKDTDGKAVWWMTDPVHATDLQRRLHSFNAHAFLIPRFYLSDAEKIKQATCSLHPLSGGQKERY